MLIYVCAAKKGIPRCLDYNASVSLKNGRPIFRSLWVSEHLKKLLEGVRPLGMKVKVKPRLTFWPKEFVEEMEPEYIFDVPKEYQRVENTQQGESSDEDKI